MWLTELKIILNLSISASPKQIPLPEKNACFWESSESVKIIFVIIYVVHSMNTSSSFIF